MMDIWNKLRTPPPDALKTIQAGRLRGKSDINPQWRYERLTEVFGVVGHGWKYEIVRLWSEPGADGQVMAFATVNLYVVVDGLWSEPIPAVGGSMAIEKEKNGLYTNDEAYKMAVTDALGTAAKMLGLAADIYRGTYDGSKYVKPQPQPQPEPQPEILPETVQTLASQLHKCRTAAQAAGKIDLMGKADDYAAIVQSGVVTKDEVQEISKFLHEAAFEIKGAKK